MKTHKFTCIELVILLMMLAFLFGFGVLLWFLYDAVVSLGGVIILCG